MRKLFLLFAIAFFGCMPPVPVVDTTTRVIVKNSLWQDVPADTVARALGFGSRQVSDSELFDAVDEYNQNTLDDFLRVYIDEAPGIEDSPPVNVYIVNPVTYAVNMAQENIARILLVENEAGWRQDSQGQLLFIDHVPPPPIIDPITDPYAYYAIYIIDDAGGIVFEDHCGYREDRLFYQVDIGDYASTEVYYPLRVNQLRSELNGHPGWYMVTRELYTAP